MARRKWSKEEISEYRRSHSNVFYFNRGDSNIIVSKAYGGGFTLNWSHPVSWLIVIAIIAFLLWLPIPEAK